MTSLYQSALNPPGLLQHDTRVHWGNLSGSSSSLAMASLVARMQTGITVVIAPDIHTARRFELELKFFTHGQQLPCHYFPDWETLPYDHFSPHPDLVSERLAVLHQLLHLKRGIMIAALPTLMHKIMPKPYLLAHTMALSLDEELNLSTFRRQLDQAGY